MESVTQTKDRLSNKEEMKRKLEEMRLKYDKMQRKLLKSERRRNARNHVRKVLAEQANASSPHPSDSNLSSTCKSTATFGSDASHNSVEGEELSKNGRSRDGRNQALQRSITFRFEERGRENELENIDCERESYDWRRTREERSKAVGINLTPCLQRENIITCGGCGKVVEQLEICKESRLSDCKGSTSGRTEDEHHNRAEAGGKCKTCMDHASVECELHTKQDNPVAESHESVNLHQRNLLKEDPQSASEKSGNEVDNRVRLKWRGIFMKHPDLNSTVAWSGVCFHQLESIMLLVLYHSHLAVLWVHTDNWDAKQQWQIEKGKEITDVVLGGEAAEQVTVLLMMKDDQRNTLSLMRYNLESGSEEVEDVNLPDSLREAEELKTVLHRGGIGVVMKKTSKFLSDFWFFQYLQPSQMWQPEGLKEISAVTFIAVLGAPNLFLCLSSNILSLWMPASGAPLVDVGLDKVANIQVDEILWADSGGGLLFFIGLQHPSILSLYVLNPATATVLKIHTFLQPCAYDSQRILDISINGQFLMAMYSGRKFLIWDIYSGCAVAEMSLPNDDIHQLTGASHFLMLNGKEANLYEYTTLH